MSLAAKRALRVTQKEGVATVLLGWLRRRTKKRKLKLPPKPVALANALKGGKGLMHVNLLNLYQPAQAITDIPKLLRRIALKRPHLEAFFAKLSNPEWQQLLMKARHVFDRAVATSSDYVSAIKGLLLEISIIKSARFDLLKGRLAAKLSKAAKKGDWVDELHVVTGARTLDGREIGDILVVAYSKDKKRVWVMAIVESKSESNAIALIDHATRGRSDDVLEVIGQHGTGVKRLQESGVRIDKLEFGKGSIQVEPPKKGLDLQHEENLTEFIGVVPPDTAPGVLNKLRSGGPRQGVQIEEHTLLGKDATAVSEEIGKELEELRRVSD